MKNSPYLESVKSFAIALFLGLFVFSFVPASSAEKLDGKEKICKLHCNKMTSQYQQSCNQLFTAVKSSTYKNVDRLVTCVQKIQSRVNYCEYRCLNPRPKPPTRR